jgi:hypothetical protein
MTLGVNKMNKKQNNLEIFQDALTALTLIAGILF